jgi:hypothetical protein
MGRPAREAYDALIDDLLAEPQEVRFPVGPDEFEDTPLLAEDVSYLAFANAYFDTDRHLFLRALAAANRGDHVPMLRLYSTAGVGISSIVNMAVTCLDGSLPGEGAAEEISLLESARGEAGTEDRWQYEIALPCTSWPHVDHARPAEGAFDAPDVPVLLVAATADPATPYEQALSLRDQIEDASLLTVDGGYHVMFGRGFPCIDEPVTRFVLGGEAEDSSCDVAVAETYVPLIPVDGTDDEVFTGIDNEMVYLPEILSWDGYSPMSVGCTLGGDVTFVGTDTTTTYTMRDCAVGPDLVVTGEGTWDYELGTTEMTARLAADACSYEFFQDWSDRFGTVEADCS